MPNMRISLGFLLLTLQTLMPESIAQDAAVALKASLLANYDKSLRPVKSVSTPVNVDFDVSIRQIIELECTLEFGSWIYNAGKLNMSQVHPKADRSTFTPSVEWIVNGAPMRRKVDFYPCCPHPFVTILIILQLERRSFFYMFNMVLPCAILMILNVFGFYIPPDSGERLGFFMTILLALVVFLQVLSGSLPKTSTTVPQLGMFFAVTIALVGFSCLASIVVIRLSYSGPAARPLPRWLRLLLLHYLARLFCMDTIAEEKHVDEGKEDVSNSSHQDSQANQPRNTPNLALDLSLREIVRYSREYLAQTWKKKLEEADQDEWKMAALVLDRALMILVGIASIVACVILLR